MPLCSHKHDQGEATSILTPGEGKSSYKLQREFVVLRKQYWGQRMWARGYFGCSTGNVSDEMIKAYIAGHTETEDRFRVVEADDFESS